MFSGCDVLCTWTCWVSVHSAGLSVTALVFSSVHSERFFFLLIITLLCSVFWAVRIFFNSCDDFTEIQFSPGDALRNVFEFRSKCRVTRDWTCGRNKNFHCCSHTWDNKTFATRTNSEFVNRPVLHIVLVDLWSAGRLANSDFVLATNVFLSCVSLPFSNRDAAPYITLPSYFYIVAWVWILCQKSLMIFI